MTNKPNSTETNTRISEPGDGRGQKVTTPTVTTGKGSSNTGNSNGSNGGTKNP